MDADNASLPCLGREIAPGLSASSGTKDCPSCDRLRDRLRLGGHCYGVFVGGFCVSGKEAVICVVYEVD